MICLGARVVIATLAIRLNFLGNHGIRMSYFK